MCRIEVLRLNPIFYAIDGGVSKTSAGALKMHLSIARYTTETSVPGIYGFFARFAIFSHIGGYKEKEKMG